MMCFKFFNVVFCCRNCFILWEKEVMSIIRFNSYLVVQIVKVGDFIQQDDIYFSYFLSLLNYLCELVYGSNVRKCVCLIVEDS